MKFTKPQHLIDAWNDHCYFTDGMKMAEFIDSLPAEFEIVQPGMTQVRWPEGLPKETLTRLADKISQQLNAWESWPAQSAALYAPAAIAPVEKKRRKVELWRSSAGDWHVSDPDDFMLGMEWRKVGECEVTE